MVYDPVNERVLLFGGAVWEDKYTFFNDFWSYDYATNTWNELECSPRPQGRFNHMMVYDPERHQLFLFGGFSAGDRIGDTWLYDIEANEWTQLHPLDSPAPRSDAAIAYDEENGSSSSTTATAGTTATHRTPGSTTSGRTAGR